MNLQELSLQVRRIEDGLSSELTAILDNYKDIILIGNGGSNALCSHIAEDYSKFLNKRTLTFSDAARLTCYINDYGIEQAYVQFLKEYALEKTLAILVSSSGESLNVVNCAKYCRDQKIDMLLFSGFGKDNHLRRFAPYAKMEYWVDSKDYGVVEISHEVLLHSVI